MYPKSILINKRETFQDVFNFRTSIIAPGKAGLNIFCCFFLGPVPITPAALQELQRIFAESRVLFSPGDLGLQLSSL